MTRSTKRELCCFELSKKPHAPPMLSKRKKNSYSRPCSLMLIIPAVLAHPTRTAILIMRFDLFHSDDTLGSLPLAEKPSESFIWGLLRLSFTFIMGIGTDSGRRRKSMMLASVVCSEKEAPIKQNHLHMQAWNNQTDILLLVSY